MTAGALARGAPRLRNRPSPWRTPYAQRTYAACAFLVAGALVSLITGATDSEGWLRVRLDLAGLLYLGACMAGGSNFLGAGWRAIRALRLDMNFLMSAAIVAAVLIGESFEAASLAALFSVAELLERFAVDRGRRSIERLLELAPESAERLSLDGTGTMVPASAIQAGERLRVRPGGRIPTDGVVVAGTSSVNQATVTGESLPVFKGPGDSVLAGTLNAEGVLDIEATADAGHSALARIVQLVREAETRRAPIEAFVKQFARYYTPAVTALALIVMVLPPMLGLGPGLEWFVRGLTLLVIACPCALVIATPVTVVSAITSAARHGVLIKGGVHLEALGRVRALAIDKTGTLTYGRLTVTRFETEPAGAQHAVLAQLLAVEQLSEHPVAAAVVAYARSRGATAGGVVEHFAAVPGQGLAARLDGAMILVGTAALLGSEVGDRWGPVPSGRMRTYARTGDAIAMVELEDEVRPVAQQVVQRLHQIGIRPVVMLTGDGEAAAGAMAQRTRVDEVRASLSPADKAAAVSQLRARHGEIAMVGDGVNDAPALAEASVGMAMGAIGSPAAIEAADVALLSDDITRIPYTIRLARRARRTIRLNIGGALGLKGVLAVGAILGVVTLPIAVLVGDLGGSLLVTLNALRVAATHDEGCEHDAERR